MENPEQLVKLLDAEVYEGFSETDKRQLSTLFAAFVKFQERNAKYRDLWKQGGIEDSANHARHKAHRLVLASMNRDQLDPEDFIDDAIDLINYAVFFIRNSRGV